MNNSLLLTLKTNISPLSMVTVSKLPSQMFGAWLSGSLGGLGGAGGGGGRGSFPTYGVTGSGLGWESVGAEVGTMGGVVGLGLDLGRAVGCRGRMSVGMGGSGWG